MKTIIQTGHPMFFETFSYVTSKVENIDFFCFILVFRICLDEFIESKKYKRMIYNLIIIITE